jgi:hypothetical protein
MDIERLKKFREWMTAKSPQGMTNAETSEIVLELIDEAIARQSATSEDVAEAIGWLETGRFEIPAGDEEYTANSSHHPNTARFRQTAIIALQEYQPWIPVSERLPDEDVASVLIYTKEGGVAEGQYYPTIRAWKQFRWSVEDSKVTHWKPLPEPPKGD